MNKTNEFVEAVRAIDNDEGIIKYTEELVKKAGEWENLNLLECFMMRLLQKGENGVWMFKNIFYSTENVAFWALDDFEEGFAGFNAIMDAQEEIGKNPEVDGENWAYIVAYGLGLELKETCPEVLHYVLWEMREYDRD